MNQTTTDNNMDNGNKCINNNNTRRLFLSRHGESQNNLYGKIGGDAPLSDRGQLYAKLLAEFVEGLGVSHIKVLTTELCRTQQTAQFICDDDNQVEVEPLLNEIQAGEHDSLTYEQIAEKYPVEFAMRDEDKLRYRYPGGESYLDVLQRLKPVIQRVINQEDEILVISHQATLRCLLGLLLGHDLEDVPYIKVPLHTVIEVILPPPASSPASEIDIIEHKLPVDCVNTHRIRPTNCSVDREIGEACLTVPSHL